MKHRCPARGYDLLDVWVDHGLKFEAMLKLWGKIIKHLILTIVLELHFMFVQRAAGRCKINEVLQNYVVNIQPARKIS